MTHKNAQMQTLIAELKAAQAPLWRAVAEDLERPTRRMPVVNLAKLSRATIKGEIVVVPGKVLGEGDLEHELTIAALGFSGSAASKLKARKATVMTIPELLKKDPKGKKVKVLA